MRSTHNSTVMPLSGRDVEQTSLALLAARAAAAVTRLTPGSIPDEYDRDVLNEIEGVVRRAADAAEFVRTNGQHGSAPKAFAAVGLAFEIAIQGKSREPEAVRTALEHIASLTKRALEGAGDPTGLPFLRTVYERLADVAMSGLSSPGDSQFQL
jgi:4-hydroxy-3-methylbut-2-en-1-yl diphosphate synthase IspG/GcpE